MPSVWTRLRGALDPLARVYGQYTAYRLHINEHVGHVDGMSVPDARDYLKAKGYTPQYLSAAKRHPETGQLHDLSYRRVPDAHPIEAEGTPIAKKSPRLCQYHVHAFRVGGGVDWFSHYEYRPLMLMKHYRPEYGATYLRGVSDLDI